MIGAVLVLDGRSSGGWATNVPGSARSGRQYEAGDGMRFENPWWLAALIPVLGVAWLVARRGGRTVPTAPASCGDSGCAWPPSSCWSSGQLSRSSPGPSTTARFSFLLDRSASISAEAAAEQEQFLALALAEARADAQTAVAVFGRDTRLDSAFTAARISGPVRTIPDDSATDLAGALEAAAALMPSEGSRRIVLITDLVPTTGDVRPAVRRLADQGVAVDVVELASARSADALVESVILPAAAREGDLVAVTAVVRSNVAGPAELIVTFADGQEQVIEVDLVAGRNEIAIEVPATGTGFLPVAVEVQNRLRHQAGEQPRRGHHPAARASPGRHRRRCRRRGG